MHVKTSGIIAGGAFALSFLVGLIGSAGFPALPVRALVFSGLFFALSEIIQMIIGRFIPDLLTGQADDALAGSHVDISVEDAAVGEPTGGGGAAAGDMDSGAQTDGGKVPDRKIESGYTGTTERGEADSKPAGLESVSSIPDVAVPLKKGELPDIKGMMDAFVEQEEEEPLVEPPPRRSSVKSGEIFGKNFDPSKVAGAIKTMLKKE
jgi:hypothetical protein